MKEVNRQPDDQGQYFYSLRVIVVSMGDSAPVAWHKL